MRISMCNYNTKLPTISTRRIVVLFRLRLKNIYYFSCCIQTTTMVEYCCFDVFADKEVLLWVNIVRSARRAQCLVTTSAIQIGRQSVAGYLTFRGLTLWSTERQQRCVFAHVACVLRRLSAAYNYQMNNSNKHGIPCFFAIFCI